MRQARRADSRRRATLAALCAALLALCAAAPPSGAADEPQSEPVFVYTPDPSITSSRPEAPPGWFEGPCGLAVDVAGNFYVSDHYHDAVDVFSSAPMYLKTHLQNVDALEVPPANGPCGLALDSMGRLYVNSYHRFVAGFTPSRYPATLLNPATFGPGTTIDSAQPTGVAVDPATDDVYVDDRTYIAAYQPSGAPLEVAGEPLRIGTGSLDDAYGLAVSGFPATAGRVYIADAASDTVKVFDPAVDTTDPVAEIDGHEIPGGRFVSLRDSALALDRVSGDVYVADDLQPGIAEEPEAAIYVFGPTGTYLGRLKYNVVDGLPVGLAVDNSAEVTQGRVYVTSGNSWLASVYAYPPGAQTDTALPARLVLGVATSGSGTGSVASDLGGIDCATACRAEIGGGSKVTLRALPDTGSVFAGWSGGGCAGAGRCTVTMSGATSVTAHFEALASPPAAASDAGAAQASQVTQKGPLRLSVGGSLSPRRLPRRGTAPIAVSIDWKVATTDGSAPPKLRKLRIEINRHGRFDYVGLPTCPYRSIQPASSARALAACRSALVGTGSFTAEIALKGQAPYVTTGRLLVFNGRSHGKTVLFGQIYSPHPFATSFVIPFTSQRLGHGAYGTALTATLPRALATWGNLTGIDMKLSRRYSYRGQRHSYLSAACPAPQGFPGAVFPLARTSFDFAGQERLTSILAGSCKANRSRVQFVPFCLQTSIDLYISSQ